MRPVKKGLIDYLESYMKARPDEVFLHSETESYTTKELYDKVRSLAALFREKGVKSGDYMGISGARTIKTVIVFLATQYLGAIAVMFDPHYSVEKCREELGVNVGLDFILDKTENGFAINKEEIDFDNLSGGIKRPRVDVFSPAVILFTSGSTGKNKGVVMSQYGYVNHQRNFGTVGGYSERDSAIQMLPIFHVFGLAQINDGIIHRCPLFFPKEVTPEYVLECIEKYGFTRFGFVPSFALKMADVKKEKGYNTDSLKVAVLAGAPSTFEQFTYIQDTLGMKIVPAYGMTELPGISGALPEESDEKRASSVGKILPLTKVRIEEDGEITAKAPSLFIGYYGERPINRRKYFHTGDLGFIDKEGFLHVTGRKKEIIIRNGNSLSALGIEKKLMKLPFVSAAAVVGMEDKECGEAPYAVVTLEKGFEYEKEAVKTVLNKLEMPKEIRIVDDIPLNASGKVDKVKIKELFRE